MKSKKLLILCVSAVCIISLTCFGVYHFFKDKTNETAITNEETTVEASNNEEAQETFLIYNAHTDEVYGDGKSISTASERLNTLLQEYNMTSEYLALEEPTAYNISFYDAGDTIQSKIADNSNVNLVDLHMAYSLDENIDFNIVLAEESPNYKENLAFANLLIKEASKNNLNGKLIKYEIGINCYNQQLGKRGLMLEIGDAKSSEEKINLVIDNLAKSLNKTAKQL